MREIRFAIEFRGVEHGQIGEIPRPDHAATFQAEERGGVANAGDMGSTPWVGKIPWRRKWEEV